MKKIAMIPARYGATRFPKKMLAQLDGKPVIVQTYLAVLATGLFDEVWVITDHQEIQEAVENAGGKVFRSIKEHESGTDRIAEAAQYQEFDVILNVQGDEPFVDKSDFENILALFNDPKVQVASLMRELHNPQDIQSPNFVKVLVDLESNALMFSRSVIPYPRDNDVKVTYYEHRGVYAFRKQALLDFTKTPMSPLECIEKIECLRFLENGIKIKMAFSEFEGFEIDTPEDLDRANELIKTRNNE